MSDGRAGFLRLTLAFTPDVRIEPVGFLEGHFEEIGQEAELGRDRDGPKLRDHAENVAAGVVGREIQPGSCCLTALNFRLRPQMFAGR